MSGGGASQDLFNQVQSETARLSQQAFGLAGPAITAEQGGVNAMLAAGGEPSYLKGAYGEERTGLTEAAAGKQGRTQAEVATATHGAALGGNISAQMGFSPQMLGSSLAEALYGSRVTEASGKIGEIDKMYSLGLGQTAQAGSAAIGLEESRAGLAGMMPNYNQEYSNVLGALNLAGAGYGAYNQFSNLFQPSQTGQGVSQGFGVAAGGGF